MLMRARNRSLGCCSEPSTAAARWRPAGESGCVARQGKLQREAKRGAGGRARRVGWFCKQEVAGLALHGGVGAAQRRRGAEQAGRLEVEESGPICNFRNFRDLTVNLQ